MPHALTSRHAGRWVDRGEHPEAVRPPLSVWLAERLLTPEELTQFGGGDDRRRDVADEQS